MSVNNKVRKNIGQFRFQFRFSVISGHRMVDNCLKMTVYHIWMKLVAMNQKQYSKMPKMNNHILFIVCLPYTIFLKAVYSPENYNIVRDNYVR